MSYYKDAAQSTFLALIVIAVAVFLTPHINHTAMHQQKPLAFKKSVHVLELDNRFFKEVINSTQPVVVKFHATWCPMCEQVNPTFNEVANSYQGKVKFVSINIEESKELAMSYGINAIPAFYFFDQGKQVGKATIGAVSKDKLEGLIKEQFTKKEQVAAVKKPAPVSKTLQPIPMH
jgi:thioredoxin 1